MSCRYFLKQQRMKALLLTLMFLISMTAFSQQKTSGEDFAAVLKDSSIVVSKDSLMSSQSIILDHHALAKSYKRKSTNYGIAAAAFGVAGLGCYKYAFDYFHSHNAPASAIIGTVCFAAAIGCTITAVVYHYKVGKELKLSIKGATANLVYTF